MSLPSSSMVEPDQQAKDRTTEGEANTSAGAAPHVDLARKALAARGGNLSGDHLFRLISESDKGG